MATAPVPDRPSVAARFPRRFRGYHPKVVDAFLRQTSRQLEELADENRLLTGRLDDLTRKLSYHEEREVAVQDAMVMAQKIRRDAQDTAEEEADRIRQEASAEAEKILEDARDELAQARERVEEMHQEASRLREEVVEEVEETRRLAQEAAESMAVQLEKEARAEASRIVAERTREVEELTAQVEKLEQRRAEFLDFLAQELGSVEGRTGDGDGPDSEPLDVPFRSEEETPVEASEGATQEAPA